VSVDTLEKLASGIGCSVEYLLGNSIGGRIKDRRLSCGLTLSETAQRTGIEEAAIKKYENGEIKTIPMKQMAIFASALNTSVAYLMFLVDDPNPNQIYNDLVKNYIHQIKKGIPDETKNAIDAALSEREMADRRLVSAAHKICFRTPESGIDDPVGPCNAMRIDVITDFILGNEKYLRVLLAAVDESQWDESEGTDASPETEEASALSKQVLTAIHESLDSNAQDVDFGNGTEEQLLSELSQAASAENQQLKESSEKEGDGNGNGSEAGR